MDEIEVLVRNAHGRVIQSMGGEAEFDKRVLSQLPLVPTDDHVMAIARPCGWQDEWMMKPTKARAKKAAAKAAASGSGNVVDMLANVSNEASSAHAASHDEAALQHDNVVSHGGSSGVPAAGMPASVAPATPVPMAAAPVPSTPVPPAARHVPSTPMELDPGAVVPPMTPMRPPRMPRQSESHAAPPCMEAVVEAARSKAGFPSYGASNGSGSHDDSRDEPFCLICRSDMHPRNEECEALPCGHAFHMACLQEWRETCALSNATSAMMPECIHCSVAVVMLQGHVMVLLVVVRTIHMSHMTIVFLTFLIVTTVVDRTMMMTRSQLTCEKSSCVSL